MDMIRLFKNLGLVCVMMLALFSCQKAATVTPPMQVNASNLNGNWMLQSINGTPLAGDTYFYIRFEMSGNKFTIWENLTSIPAGYNIDEGTFTFYVEPTVGTYIRGIDSIKDKEWSDMYYVKGLTESSMTWVGYNNPSFVQDFVRVETIPYE
jgi:hypothetical protein